MCQMKINSLRAQERNFFIFERSRARRVSENIWLIWHLAFRVLLAGQQSHLAVDLVNLTAHYVIATPFVGDEDEQRLVALGPTLAAYEPGGLVDGRAPRLVVLTVLQ